MTRVEPYDARWPEEFVREAARLRRILGSLPSEIEHVGSTAVPDLASKPILDVALGFESETTLAAARQLLSASGYEDRGDQGEGGGVVFTEGSEAARTHHLHLVMRDHQWSRYLTFRNVLRADAALREEYAALKAVLAARYAHDRSAYQHAKAPFIEATLGRLSPANNS